MRLHPLGVGEQPTSGQPRGKMPAMPARRTLYPELEPYRTGRLRVSAIHDLYFEESGNPRGKPVVFLHGGPGLGTGPKQRRFFDPGAYRIILFDQRGCGKSTPHASLDENTTWDLVDDLERLRVVLGIERWQVFGGSWGASLALAYAQTHPERVTELVLRGIFLLRRWEIDWFYQSGASAIYPDAWEAYLAPIPEAERGDLLRAYHRRLTGTDAEERQRCALSWSGWEARTSFLLPDEAYLNQLGDPEVAAAFARIECHYFLHQGFFSGREPLAQVDRFRRIPAVIVQGRYDLVCPMETAWALHRAWPEADFRIVPDAGHASYEPGITHELVEATDRFREPVGA
jgi:proline iminopeptidase